VVDGRLVIVQTPGGCPFLAQELLVGAGTSVRHDNRTPAIISLVILYLETVYILLYITKTK
jgi:hypothetical protein